MAASCGCLGLLKSCKALVVRGGGMVVVVGKEVHLANVSWLVKTCETLVVELVLGEVRWGGGLVEDACGTKPCSEPHGDYFEIVLLVGWFVVIHKVSSP